jgi:TfoX/Sxy family transcriptional regulator of competence genes
MLFQGWWFVCHGSPEIVISQIDQPVAFLRESDSIFSGNQWRAVINFNLFQYDTVITALEANLCVVKSTSRGELRQVEEILRSLKDKLDRIRCFLSRTSRKRGLFNLGSTVLKSLFGTATVLVLEVLHATVQELNRIHDAVTNSLDRQLMYYRQLDDAVKFDHQTVV